MAFHDLLESAWKQTDSLLCVGLDPNPSRLPQVVCGEAARVFAFNKAIIDATREYACAYKPQFAYYASAGLEAELEMTISYVHETCPGLPVILDAKRGDIGSTATMYAQEAFERYGADAVTVNPYMGGDTLEPFLSYADKGVVILCRTSNPGASDLQGLVCDGKPLYLHVAERAATAWNGNNNVMLVVGATAPQELADVRAACPGIPLLVPGVGAQGGSVQQVLEAGLHDRTGLLINSSRGIIYASDGDDFAEAAGRAARELRDEINRYR